MAAFSFGPGLSLDPMAEIQAAGDAGRKRGLNALLGQAYKAAPGADRQSALAKIAGHDGQMAMDAQGSFDKDDDDVHTTLAKRAQQVVGLWKANPQMAQQAYAAMLPLAQRAGIQAPGNLDESMIEGLTQLASAAAGAGESYTLSPGAKRFGPNGELLAEAPFSPDRPQNATFQVDAQGQGWWLAPGQAPQRADMPGASAPQGQPQAGMPAPQGGADVMGGAMRESMRDPQAIQSMLRESAPMFGAQLTSLQRTREHNAKVGGVANSQHIGPNATAGDFVVPPAQKPAFKAHMESRGMKVIDEGDHMHVQAQRGGQQVAQAGGIRFPTKAVAEDRPSALQERIRMAQEMGATPDELQRMVIGREGAAAGARPMPIGAVREDMAIEDALGVSENVFRVAQKHLSRIASGELEMGPTIAAGAAVRTKMGMTNGKDVAYNELVADRTKIVNDSLILNKGVQTEGDAQRATTALMNANDIKTTIAAFKRLVEVNKRGVALQQRKRQLLRSNYGQADQQQQAAPQQPASDIDSILDKYR